MEFGLHTLVRECSGDPRHILFLANLCSLCGRSTRRAFCVESQELLQNIGNEEHATGERVDLLLESEVHMSNRWHGVNCLAIPV
jgi:hypothetical protein